MPGTNGETQDERDDEIRALAKERHEKEGELEIDDNATVSESDDNGAYVNAWVWVDFADTPLDKEGEPETCAGCEKALDGLVVTGESDAHGYCAACWTPEAKAAATGAR